MYGQTYIRRRWARDIRRAAERVQRAADVALAAAEPN
jgi:hypothetical protein